MRKKGFTLIELLAVIVILAIIALIATPIVMNVIENSKKGAAERSAENYLKAVETAVGTERIDGRIMAGEYTILSGGDLCPDGIDCEAEPEKIIKIDMSGNKPSSGTIFIENGKVVEKLTGSTSTETTTIVTKDNYTVNYNGDGKLTATKNEEHSEEEGGNQDPSQGGDNGAYLCEKIGGTSKTVGAEYTCHLDTDRTFYVLENIEESENISLIMDRNFTDDTVPKTLAWCTDGGSNNTTCKNINLKEENPLKHIQDTFGDNVEVSFPTKDQITSANNGSTSNLSQWLYDHLYGTPNPESGVFGYWTASPLAGGANSAWLVRYNGNVSYYSVDSSSDTGVRPVITISKTQLD